MKEDGGMVKRERDSRREGAIEENERQTNRQKGKIGQFAQRKDSRKIIAFFSKRQCSNFPKYQFV